MKTKLWAQLLVVSVCLFAVWGVQANCVLIPSEEAARIVGGNGGQIPKWCIQTNMTCPDPNYSTTCTYNATDNWCYQCVMRVSSWTNCKFNNDSNYSCGQTVLPTSPYCGRRDGGRPVSGTNCTGACGYYPNDTCGSQIPNTNGVPCLP